jgi:hypothetical protein
MSKDEMIKNCEEAERSSDEEAAAPEPQQVSEENLEKMSGGSNSIPGVLGIYSHLDN